MPQRPRAPFFRHAMPWEQRTLLGVLSLALLVGSFIALFFIGVLVWAIFTA